MTKKKRQHPDVEEILSRPWCYYCERDFDDLKILINHQKAKHFKCERCGRRLNTAGGLSVHMSQVHKENLTAVDNALPNRAGLDIEIFGMEGIPEDIVQQHSQRVLTTYHQAQADRQAATGNTQASGGAPNGNKKPKIEQMSDLKKRLAEHKAAKLAAEQGSAANSGNSTPVPPTPSQTQTQTQTQSNAVSHLSTHDHFVFIWTDLLARLPRLPTRPISNHMRHLHQMVHTANLPRLLRPKRLAFLSSHPCLFHMVPLHPFQVHMGKLLFLPWDNQVTIQRHQPATHNHMLNHLQPRSNNSIPIQLILLNQAFPLPHSSINFQDRGKLIFLPTVFRNHPTPLQLPRLPSRSSQQPNIMYHSVPILLLLMGIFQHLFVQAV